MPPELTDTDAELLSAYLDGMLTDSETAALEQRLATDAALRRELAALRQTIDLINALPPLVAPRSFTLTPDMVGLPEAETVEPSPALMMKKVMVMPVAPAKRRLRPRGWQPAAFAAAAVFIVAVGFTLVLTMTAPQSAPQIAAQPTNNPAFSNMVTGIEPEPSEPQEESQAAQRTTDAVPPLAVQLPTQGLLPTEGLLNQVQSGAELALPSTQGQPAAAPTQLPATPTAEAMMDILPYQATPLPEGMGGGFQGDGTDVQDGFLAGESAPQQNPMAANDASAMSATRVAVNTDPDAPGFSVRPADEPTTTLDEAEGTNNEQVFPGSASTGLVDTNTQESAPVPPVPGEAALKNALTPITTLIQSLMDAITAVLEQLSTLSLPGTQP
jgi:hypothetical protein